MKKYFQSQLQAIDWIANYSKNEGQFEVLREQLLFNYIYHGTHFLSLNKKEMDAPVMPMKRN